VPAGTTVVVKQRLPHRPASPLPASILPRAADAAEWRHGSRHPLFPEKLNTSCGGLDVSFGSIASVSQRLAEVRFANCGHLSRRSIRLTHNRASRDFSQANHTYNTDCQEAGRKS
jgi:hypothetical protein